MNTELRKKAKNDFEKDFFKLMNNSVFGKTMENDHTTKRFSESLRAIEIKKTKLKLNKLIYLGFSILDLRKIVMYEFWYDYIKPKYGKKAR